MSDQNTDTSTLGTAAAAATNLVTQQATQNWLKSAISDGENVSASRVMAVATVAACVLIPMIWWAGMSVAHHRLEEIPGSLIGFMGAANALVLGLFHLNKREETKTAGAT